MAQFIHLSLLLAVTVQLSLGSVARIQLQDEITFKQECKVKKCCRDQLHGDSWISTHCRYKVTKPNDQTITSVGPNDSGNYICYCNSGKCIHHLNSIVTKGCIKKRLEGFEFPPQRSGKPDRGTEDDCRRLCTEPSPCKYSTFNTRNKKCFLISRHSVTEENKHSVSDCPDRTIFSETDDTVDLQFHQEAKSWFDAFKHCKEMNGSLVQNTTSMQCEVSSLLQNHSSSVKDGVWIGLERSMFGKHKIPWKWISGLEVGEPGQWSSSFPVDRFNNHCGKIIQANETDFKWLDAWCHERLPFICQNSTDSTGRHSGNHVSLHCSV